MTQTEFDVALVGYHKGAYTKAIWQSVQKCKDGSEITKVTEGIVRLGIHYSHIKGVQPKGDRQNVFLKGYSQMLIQGKSGILVQMIPSHHRLHKAKVRYYRNGAEISREQAELLLTKKPHSSPLVMFTPLLANVIKIGK